MSDYRYETNQEREKRHEQERKELRRKEFSNAISAVSIVLRRFASSAPASTIIFSVFFIGFFVLFLLNPVIARDMFIVWMCIAVLVGIGRLFYMLYNFLKSLAP